MKHTLRGILFVLVLLSTKAVAASSFLHIEAIRGEVREKGYEDWIDVWSLNFEIDREDGGHELPPFSEFSVVKGIDKASPLLFREAAMGEAIPTVLIDFFRDSALEPRYLRVRLSDVMITSYSLDQDPTGATETVSLNFSRIELEQTKPDNSGTTRVYYEIGTQKGGALPDGPPPGGNIAPTISAIEDRSLSVNSSLVVEFAIDDLETSPNFLTLNGESSNEDLVPISSIAFGGSGSNRTATITPAPNTFGSSEISIRVSDGISSATSQFTVTVEQPEGPFISSIADVAVGEGDSTTVGFTIGHPTADLDSLSVTASAEDQQLLPTENISFAGTGANRTAELSPATGMIGETEITITVSDGTLAEESSFLLTVEAVSPAPTITSPGRVEGVAGRPLSVADVSVSDPAAGTAPISLTMTAPGAVLTLASDVPGGLIPSDIQGNGTAEIAVSATLAAINATLEAGGGFTYARLSPGDGEISLEASRSGSSSANIEVFLFDSSMSRWRHAFFSADTLNDPAKEETLWGNLANPSHDGTVNLLKYALGLSPLESHSSQDLPGVYLIEEGGSRYLAFTIVRRTDDPSLEYIPQISSDLQNWDSGEAVLEEHGSTPAGDGFEQVVFRHPLSGESPSGRFVRLQVTQNVE